MTLGKSIIRLFVFILIIVVPFVILGMIPAVRTTVDSIGNYFPSSVRTSECNPPHTIEWEKPCE